MSSGIHIDLREFTNGVDPNSTAKALKTKLTNKIPNPPQKRKKSQKVSSKLE
jgi:hypothetical protein